MKAVQSQKKGYLSKLAAALGTLRCANEMLSPRNIRPDRLRYFFAFPLAMAFVNTQDLMLGEGVCVFGLAYTTITFLAFIAGAVILFALTTQKNLSVIL